MPRQCWEKLLELCASGLQVLRDCFKKLQLSHVSFGKNRTIPTDCAGKDRQSLLMEAISWHLFMGSSWRSGSHRAQGQTWGCHCRRTELQLERTGLVRVQCSNSPTRASLASSRPGVLSPTHTKVPGRGWRAGRAGQEALLLPLMHSPHGKPSEVTEPGA